MHEGRVGKFLGSCSRLGWFLSGRRRGENLSFWGLNARFCAKIHPSRAFCVRGCLLLNRPCILPLTPSFVGSNPATPAMDTIYCIRNALPNTIYGFCFIWRVLSSRSLWGRSWGNCGAKGRRFIGYNRSFAPLARDTLSSSRYSLCPRRRTSRPCRTNDPPRA